MQQSGGSSGWHLGFGAHPKDAPIRVLLLGQAGVGKTAIAVRLATRRFIGEYDCSKERVYRASAVGLSWEIADPPGSPPGYPSESRLRWADVVLLVYSINDRVSFDESWRLRFLLNRARASRSRRQAVVLLLGNKSDLPDRMVSSAEGRQRARDVDAHGFFELSARESLEQVMAVLVCAARFVVLLPLVGAEPAEPQPAGQGCTSAFRLRASTDSSLDARRRPRPHQHFFTRRLSISARGAPL